MFMCFGVCLCVCVYVCVCVSVFMYVFMCEYVVFMYVCVYVYACWCVLVCLCLCVCMCLCLCMCSCMYICVFCVCLYVCLCMCSCTYMCVLCVFICVFVISHVATACLFRMCNTATRISDICRDLFPVQTKHDTVRSDKQNSSDTPISNNQRGKRNDTGQILRIRVNLHNSMTNCTGQKKKSSIYDSTYA
jgi:hypothetical protein